MDKHIFKVMSSVLVAFMTAITLSSCSEPTPETVTYKYGTNNDILPLPYRSLQQ